MLMPDRCFGEADPCEPVGCAEESRTNGPCSGGSIDMTGGVVVPANGCLGTTFTGSPTMDFSYGSQITTIVCTNSCGDPCTEGCPAPITNGISPSVLSVAWTATVRSWSTNGTTVPAIFAPTNCGVGNITFTCQWSDGCTNTSSSSASVAFNVVKVDIAETEKFVCVCDTASFSLTNSCDFGMIWEVITNGVPGEPTVIDNVITAGTSCGSWTVIGRSALNTNCADSATLTVIKIVGLSGVGASGSNGPPTLIVCPVPTNSPNPLLYFCPIPCTNVSQANLPPCWPGGGGTNPACSSVDLRQQGTFTITATAGCSSASVIVIVQDTNPPSISCPDPGMDWCNDFGYCSALIDLTWIVGASDNCGAATLTFSPDQAEWDVGEHIITATATDVVGQTAECTFTLYMFDCENPTISCPSDITVPTTTNQCTAVVNYPAPTVSDNCPGVTYSCTWPSGSTFQKGVTTVTCTATDAAGNESTCTFKVTVQDLQKPAINCASDMTVNTAPGQCSAVVNYSTPTATDNCPGVTRSCNPPSGSSFPKGTNTVTCTATDTSGNTTNCTFKIIVIDNQPPTVTCPANITRNTRVNSCDARVTFAATATDNCPEGLTVTCNPPSGSFFPKGTTTVTCTATDAAGNTSAPCSFTVTVVDNRPPTIVCSTNITVCGTSSGANVWWYAPTIYDNCRPWEGTSVCSPAAGSVFPPGITTVTCTATDSSGNTATCSFTVTVIALGNVVEARRTSAPAENFFPIKNGEHFEVGGTFEFQLVGGSTVPTSLIKWEIWDLDGIDDKVANGPGSQFSYTWASGVAEGDAYVRFYCDISGDNQHNFFENFQDSEEFWVQQIKVYNLSVRYSTLLTITAAEVQNVFSGDGCHKITLLRFVIIPETLFISGMSFEYRF